MSKNQVSRVSGLLWLALLLLTPALSFAGVVGQGTVVGWGGKDFVIADADSVEGGHEVYQPTEDTKWAQHGQKYDQITVNGKERSSQIAIIFEGDNQHRDLGKTTLRQIGTAVTDAKGGNKPIREGDTVKILTHAEDGGGVHVTLEFCRGTQDLGAISFVQKN